MRHGSLGAAMAYCLVYGQTLAALGAAPPQDVPAVLRVHAHEKAVSAAAAPAIGLKGAFQGASRPGAAAPRRNPDPSERLKTVSIMVDSPPFRDGADLWEFSTPVEKTVEILGFSPDAARNLMRLQEF